MIKMNPYFNFNGNTGDAMNFYKSVFGGEFTSHQQFKGMPCCEQMAPEDQEKFMHITLTTTKGLTFMATDILESMGQKLILGNNAHVCIHTESEAETDKLFNALSLGGKVEMPVNKTFWGAYCGMCQDKFGIQWMLNYSYENSTIK
ncbi:MAG: VOC family protein [Bacteroidetes bacterium]|nr:VOC family protein [Bacteroidota bacterium]